MYLTEPMHIQAEIIGLSGSSSDRQIRHNFSSSSQGLLITIFGSNVMLFLRICISLPWPSISLVWNLLKFKVSL